MERPGENICQGQDFDKIAEDLLFAEEETLDFEEDIATVTDDDDLNIKAHIKGNEIVFYHQGDEPSNQDEVVLLGDKNDRKCYKGSKCHPWKSLDNPDSLAIERTLPLDYSNRKCTGSNRTPFIKEIRSGEDHSLVCEINGALLKSVPRKSRKSSECSEQTTYSLNSVISRSHYSEVEKAQQGAHSSNHNIVESIYDGNQIQTKFNSNKNTHGKTISATFDMANAPKSSAGAVDARSTFRRSITQCNPCNIDNNAITLTKVLPVIVQPIYNQKGEMILSKQTLSSPPGEIRPVAPSLTMNQRDFRRLLPNGDIRKEWHGKLCAAKERKHVKDLANAFETLRLHLPKLKRHKRMTTKLMILREAISYIRSLYETLAIDPDTKHPAQDAVLLNPDVAMPVVSYGEWESPSAEAYITDWNNNNPIPQHEDCFDIEMPMDHSSQVEGLSATRDIIRAAFLESCLLPFEKSTLI